MRRTSVIVTAVFAGLLILLEGLLAFYWETQLEPRLRSDAESHAKLLAQSNEASLVAALRSGEGASRKQHVVDVMDRILLLKEATSESKFVNAIRLEIDYDAIDAEPGTLDITRGTPVPGSFSVDVALFDPETFELLGIAWMDMSPAFFERLAMDVRHQVTIQGVAILVITLTVWALLLVVLEKLERTSEARRRAEQSLRVHEKKFGRLLDDLGTYFVYSRDQSGRFTEVSDSVEQVLGVTSTEFLDEYLDLLGGEESEKGSLLRLTSPPADCGPGRVEIEIRDRAGGIHRIELTEVVVIGENGGVSGIDGIAHDVTEQRAFELALREARSLAEEANLAKSQFLANVSHEVRTPMNAILGMTVLALRTELDSRQRNYLEKIHSSGRLLLRIINDILDLSRIEAGKLTVQRTEFRFDDVLNDLSGVVGERAREKGLEVLFAVDPEAPRYVRGDPVRLQQVLVNLVNNAVKFTHEGEIVVSVAVERADEEQSVIRFEVSDTGPGIPEEEIDRLFDPFTQVDESTSRQYGGVGLGLAISKRLVNLMGGEISCRSRLGEGSTFTFTIVAGTAEKAVRRALRRSELEGLSVLIVDDNATARRVFSDMLRSLGFEATSVSRAETAIDEIKRRDELNKPFSLVLMDWKMPGLDGIEAAKQIKNSALREVPAVVLVTAYSGIEFTKQAEQAGVDVFVNKPVSRSAMWNAVLEALGRPEERILDSEATSLLGSIHFDESLRVLLVEDNELNREVAREMLSLVGLSVDEAESGEAAIRSIRERVPDAVLMDVHMPGMDGLEVTRRIRAELHGERLPVIALTAHAMMGDRQRFLDAGMDDYIAKPIEEDQLLEVLARWLPHQFTEDAAAPKADLADLPEIPGVDVGKGARRLQGNVQLLRRLVNDLATRFADAAGDVERAVAAGDREAAANLAHTLKGAAGSLAAERVFRASSEVEQALRAGSDVGRLLPELQAALEELPGERTIVEAGESSPHAEPDSTEGVAVDAASAALEELADHLSANSLGAVGALERLRETLDGTRAGALTRLEAQIDGLKFEEALEGVETLRRELGLVVVGDER